MDDALSGLGEIYDTFAPRIFRYVYHRLGDQTLAEDLTSEVFIRFLDARTSPEHLSGFLFRIAHNLIVDYLRRHHPVRLVNEIHDPRDDPVRHAEIEIERARMRRVIARLAPDQQQVIVLKFLEGFSNEEIARVIGKSVGAVKALQFRGLATLRDLLSGEVRNER